MDGLLRLSLARRPRLSIQALRAERRGRSVGGRRGRRGSHTQARLAPPARPGFVARGGFFCFFEIIHFCIVCYFRSSSSSSCNFLLAFGFLLAILSLSAGGGNKGGGLGVFLQTAVTGTRRPRQRKKGNLDLIRAKPPGRGSLSLVFFLPPLTLFLSSCKSFFLPFFFFGGGGLLLEVETLM